MRPIRRGGRDVLVGAFMRGPPTDENDAGRVKDHDLFARPGRFGDLIWECNHCAERFTEAQYFKTKRCSEKQGDKRRARREERLRRRNRKRGPRYIGPKPRGSRGRTR